MRFSLQKPKNMGYVRSTSCSMRLVKSTEYSLKNVWMYFFFIIQALLSHNLSELFHVQQSIDHITTLPNAPMQWQVFCFSWLSLSLSAGRFVIDLDCVPSLVNFCALFPKDRLKLKDDHSNKAIFREKRPSGCAASGEWRHTSRGKSPSCRFLSNKLGFVVAPWGYAPRVPFNVKSTCLKMLLFENN